MPAVSKFRKCPNCGEWDFVRAHVCPPRWQVAPADDPDDTHPIYASDGQIAAEIFADLWDDEGIIAYHGGNIDVIVISPDGHQQQLTVTGGMVAEYHAEPTQETNQ